jgi:hypothetical protein
MSIERTDFDSQDDVSPSSSALEQRLVNWQPASASTVLDRDRLMFEAGCAAARAGSWGRLGWLTSACLALVAIALGGQLAREHGKRSLRSPAAALAAAPSASIAEENPPAEVRLDAASCFVLTQRVLAAGADDLVPVVSDHPADDGSGSFNPPITPLRGARDSLLAL